LPIQETLVLIKPDAFEKKIWHKIPGIYKRHRLKIVHVKFVLFDRDLIEKHYQEHRDKPFFNDLINFMTSGPILALRLKGKNAIARVRKINEEIRKNYASRDQLSANVVHGSDSPESAGQEIRIFFRDNSSD